MSQIEITVNGNRTAIPALANVQSVLDGAGYDGKYVAVALNEEFIPRVDYATQVLEPGDCLEIVMPFAGG